MEQNQYRNILILRVNYFLRIKVKTNISLHLFEMASRTFKQNIYL